MRNISAELKQAILLSRYHSTQPRDRYPTFRSCRKIANIVRLTTNQVTHICNHYFERREPKPRKKGIYNVQRPGRPRQIRRRYKPLKPEHIEYLTGDATLRG